MGWISEPEDGDSRLQVSSSKAEITNGAPYLQNTEVGDSLSVRGGR